MDGANLNAIMGRFKPGEAGFDVMHINVHKTFCHSPRRRRAGRRARRSGGEAAALPALTAGAARSGRHASGSSRPASGRPASAGCAHSPVTSVFSSALTRTFAPTAARACAKSVTTPSWPPTTSRPACRAFSMSRSPGRACTSSWLRPRRSSRRPGIRTLDVAKRLIDYGFHPPTIYFPLTVEEALLIEPTETESIETLDAFVDALKSHRRRGRTRIRRLSTRHRTARPSAVSTRPPPPASRTCAGEP